MKLIIRVALFTLLAFSATIGKTQGVNISSVSDSIPAEIIAFDSIATLEQPAKVHLPRKATMYSAVLPGLGQIYNRKWWKVPFIYAGFGYIGMQVINYHREYYASVVAYQDLNDGKSSTTSYYNLEGFPYTDVNEQSATSESGWIETYAQNNVDNRDRFIIFAAGLYLINILDANVNAHFLDFDISEDLSLNINPNVSKSPINTSPAPGLTLVYNF